MTVYNKIAQIQNEIGVLEKDADNPFFKSQYLTLDKIVANLRPLLTKHKLLVTQMPQNATLETLVKDLEDDSELKSNCDLQCPPNDPQKQGSAITYARRYALGCIFQIQTEEDDDGNKTVSKPAIKSKGEVMDTNFAQSLEDLGTCPKCGAPMKLSKTGSKYCSALCWKN